MYYNPTTKQLTPRPRISGITNPNEATILVNGWVKYVDNPPTVQEGERAVKTTITEEGVQQYDVVPIPTPETCTPAQGKVLLHRLGALAQVEQMVSQDVELSIFWNNALIWEKHKPIMQSLAAQLNQDIDEFFTEANKIDT